MPKYQIRFDTGKGPDGSDDEIEVEAGGYLVEVDFINFYKQMKTMGTVGKIGQGTPLRSIAKKYVIEVVEQP